MASSIQDLMTPLTEEQVYETLLDICRGLDLPVDSWWKGNALRVILRAVSRVYSGFTAIMAAFIKSGFLETAEGEWLTKLALYVYGVTRREATFAKEDITFVNTGGFVHTQGIGTVTVIAPGTKKAYRNTEAFVLGALSSLDVEFEAVEIGSASSAAAGTITQLETTLTGVTLSQTRAFIAIDGETDAEVRQACRDKLASLSVRGPRGAYAWAVREAKRLDGNAVNINRQKISSSSSKGTVNVYVAAPSGAPVSTDITAVEESIELRARPDGVTVTVAAATEVPVVRALTVWASREDGVSADDIKALVESTFVREGATFPIGGMHKPPSGQGKLYADWIAAKAIGAHGSIYDIDGAGSDVSLGAGEIALLQVTATVNVVDPTEAL